MTTPAWLKPLYTPVPVSLGGFLTLTNVGNTYDATNGSKGLGCATVDLTNVAAIDFTVKVNKIGNGTQSWQLWNETDGAEIGVIDDAGAAGEKTLQATFAVALSGIKLLRVRAKSTTTADDPVYFGSCILLR
jgi:hypothetical protein